MSEQATDVICTACGVASPPGFRFCGGCGAKLDRATLDRAGGAGPRAARPDRGTIASERRQVTVMFCDLVGSTQLGEQLDPEDLRELILAYRDVCAAAVSHYDGSVARYLGDGILVYFGYPKAHEDDPRRAILAALDIRMGMRRLNESLAARRWPRLELRIGIHTGLVVAGDMGTARTHEPMAVVGSAPNVAARLQALAAPDAIIVSSVTHDIVEGWFAVRPLGARVLAGIAEPVAILEILNETGVRDRLSARPVHSTLLGRSHELRFLAERWVRAGEAEGQCVVIQGDPGIGKSRLLLAFQARAGIEPSRILRCQCAEYYETSAFHPIAALVQHALASSDVGRAGDAGASGQASIAAGLDPALAALLEPAAAGEDGSDAAVDPELRRQRLMEGLADWIVGAARDSAVLFVVEDLQWADDSTLSFLRGLVGRCAGTRLLIVATTRLGDGGLSDAGSGDAGRVAHLSLHALPLDEARDLVARTAGKPLPEEVVVQILARTDGVPLFVEELTRMVIASPLLIERGDRFEIGAAGAPTIPMTLRDSLMARLDGLGPSKRVAQIASVLGRSFPELLVRLVAEIQQALLEEHLATLVQSQFFCREPEEEQTYAFTHALLQDASYDSLLRETRRLYHRRTAGILEKSFPDAVRLQPEILARHHALAGNASRAVELWEIAGRRSAQRSANVEATAQIGNALALLPELPDDEARRRRELPLQIAFGGQLIITAGNADSRVERAFERARLLSEELAEPTMLFQARRGLLSFYQVRGRPRIARALGDDMLAQAEATGDPDLLVQAHRAVGLCRFFLGELRPAEHHLTAALERAAASAGNGGPKAAFISDPVVLARCNLGWVSWFLGRPDTARDHCESAVARARGIRHQHSLAYALSLAAAVHLARREPARVITEADEVLSLAGRSGFSYWRAWARGLRGWALATLGDLDAGLGDLDTALGEYAATGAEVMRPYFLTLKAEILTGAGRLAEAGQALAAAEGDISAHGMAFCHGEVLRLQAGIAAGTGDRAGAERMFAEAIAVTEAQGADMLLLRIASDRTRLCGGGGGGEGAAMLRTVLGRVTEGLSTADVTDARRVLGAASRPPKRGRGRP